MLRRQNDNDSRSTAVTRARTTRQKQPRGTSAGIEWTQRPFVPSTFRSSGNKVVITSKIEVAHQKKASSLRHFISGRGLTGAQSPRDPCDNQKGCEDTDDSRFLYFFTDLILRPVVRRQVRLFGNSTLQEMILVFIP